MYNMIQLLLIGKFGVVKKRIFKQHFQGYRLTYSRPKIDLRSFGAFTKSPIQNSAIQNSKKNNVMKEKTVQYKTVRFKVASFFSGLFCIGLFCTDTVIQLRNRSKLVKGSLIAIFDLILEARSITL